MSIGYVWSLLVKDPLIIGCTIFMGAVSFAVSFFDREGRAQHAVAQRWAKMLLGLAGARVKVTGLEKLRPGENYVFAGNHLSLYDTPVVLAKIPRQFLFLVASKYVSIPILGTHLRRGGHYSIDISDVKGSLRVMSEAAVQIRDKGRSILLFPEGRRATAEMGEFKEGAAYIAIKAGVPVVPFALRGTREILAIGSLHVKGGPVEFILGDPIPTNGLSLKDREKLTARMRSEVEQLLNGVREGVPA